MGFFDDLPPDLEPPEDDLPEPERELPEWLGPPGEVLGGVVPLAAPVVRTGHVFVGLRAATAYPTGLSLGLELAVRRGDLPRERWRSLTAAFWEHEPPRPGARPGPGALRFGIELADGRRTGTYDRFGQPPGAVPEPPVLVLLGGEGSGGSRLLERRQDLWVWPLPAGDSLAVVLQWPELEVPVTTHRIDLRPVRAAAALALPYWP